MKGSARVVKMVAMALAVLAAQAAQGSGIDPDGDLETQARVARESCKAHGKEGPECMGFLAIEARAWFKACPSALARGVSFFKRPSAVAEARELADGWWKGWEDLDRRGLRAFAERDGRVFASLVEELGRYLGSIPYGEVGIECSRLGVAKDGKGLADMSSDILGFSKPTEWVGAKNDVRPLVKTKRCFGISDGEGGEKRVCRSYYEGDGGELVEIDGRPSGMRGNPVIMRPAADTAPGNGPAEGGGAVQGR